MQRKLTFLAPLLVAVVLAACAGPLQTGPTPPAREFLPAQVVEPEFYPFTGDTGVQQFDLPTVWFVEVDGTPTVDGGSIQALSQSVAGVFAAADDAGVALEPRYVFSTFITGFSVAATPAELLTLANLPGVKQIMPVGIVEAPSVERHDPAEVLPQLTTAIGITGADYVHDTLGFDGTGVRVGIVDTGILLNHPEFGGRVQFGFDFVGDFYNAGDPLNDVPVPEPGPFTRPGGGDCNGHGTHVAGIVGAGAGGEVTGVAPGVTLGAYRVFGCAGSAHSDVIVAAVEQAFADGMDVVNLSLGSNNGWPQDFSSAALSRMLDFGMIPVASAGNNGASGIYTVGSPGAGENVITVASFDNVSILVDKMIVDATEMGYATLTGTPDTPTSGTTPEIVYVGQGCAADDYLDDPTDKVALVTRGACTFAEKYFRAFAEGAVGVIIENNAPGMFFGTIGETSDLGFGISISGVNGALIKAAIDGEAGPFITWTDETILEGNPTGELISAFSSYGLAPDLTLKPDIGAPGGFINSTIIDGAEPGVAGTAGYAVLSGTSMSAPHVAGAVALMLEARPDVTRDRVRDHLMNAADLVLWNLNPGLGFLDSVHRQGAGMMRIDNAILNKNYAVPAKLSLGESADGTYTDVVTIHNDTAETVTYLLLQIEDFGTAPIATTGNSNAPGFALAAPLVEYFELRQSSFYDPIDQVTVPAGGVVRFQVRVTANPGAAQGTVFGTYLVFLPVNGVPGALPILVPAAGFAGDYQQLPLVNFLPELVVSFLGDLYLVPPSWVYTMAGEDTPYFALGMAHAAQRMTVEIVPLGERTWMGPQPALEAELVRRNNPGGLSVYGFAGDFDATGLPTGEYKFRMHLLKALGDPTNPAHTVVVESPPFFIDRGFEF